MGLFGLLGSNLAAQRISDPTLLPPPPPPSGFRGVQPPLLPPTTLTPVPTYGIPSGFRGIEPVNVGTDTPLENRSSMCQSASQSVYYDMVTTPYVSTRTGGGYTWYRFELTSSYNLGPIPNPWPGYSFISTGAQVRLARYSDPDNRAFGVDFVIRDSGGNALYSRPEYVGAIIGISYAVGGVVRVLGPTPWDTSFPSDFTNADHITIHSAAGGTGNHSIEIASIEVRVCRGEIITPTPTPTEGPIVVCVASVISPLTPPEDRINLRERPGLGQTILGVLGPGVPVELIDGIEHEGYWWWHIRVSIPDVSPVEAYVREDVVQDDDNCSRITVEPPPLPQPEGLEICHVKLTGASAEVRDGNSVLVGVPITDQALLFRVYGVNYARDQYLISEPGILPQQWVDRTLFASDPPNARACKKDTVLGRFYKTSDPVYWAAVGAYSNGFRAPVSPTQFDTEYVSLRNSYHYIPPTTHGGTDVVYRPPDGTGDSIPFDAYAQSNGIIVDAGPDGITKAYRYEKDYCGQTASPHNPFADRAGVFFWAVPIICTDESGQSVPGVKAVYFVAVMGNEDETPDNDKAEQPATGWYDFGLRQADRDSLQRDYGFINVCSTSPQLCVLLPGRRVIIWYDTANDEPNGIANRPEIKTVYYHISVDEHSFYSQWRGLCSKDRNMTWAKTMIENDPAYNVCKVNTALDSGGFRIGQVRRIGFATAAHLHYEVHIDRHNDGNLDDLDNRDREDPLMAFQTIR